MQGTARFLGIQMKERSILLKIKSTTKVTHLRIVCNAFSLIIVAVAYLKTFKEGTKFILIGHSVGAYICLQVCYSIINHQYSCT